MADLGTLNEGTTTLYEAYLKDETGAPIDGGALDSLTLTVHDSVSLVVVNSRNAQDVLNKNGVTVTALGKLTWLMTPADNAMLSTAKTDKRTAIFVGKWASGAKQVTHDFTWTVRNLSLFPPA